MPTELRTLLLIWGSMLSSVTLFAAILMLGAVEPDGEADPITAFVLIVPAIFTAGLSAVGVPMFFKHLPAQSAWIVRFACAEAVALFGFAGYFVGGSGALTAGFFAASYALLLLARPSPDAVTAWEMRRLK